MSHTPGPWYWEKSNENQVRLFTLKNGHCIVMDFVREGMQGAQPRFSDRGDKPLGGVMRKATEIDLDLNPDARLITAAPDLLAACKELEVFGDRVDQWMAKGNLEPMWYDDFSDAIENARAAIKKAEGK